MRYRAGLPRPLAITRYGHAEYQHGALARFGVADVRPID